VDVDGRHRTVVVFRTIGTSEAAALVHRLARYAAKIDSASGCGPEPSGRLTTELAQCASPCALVDVTADPHLRPLSLDGSYIKLHNLAYSQRIVAMRVVGRLHMSNLC